MTEIGTEFLDVLWLSIMFLRTGFLRPGGSYGLVAQVLPRRQYLLVVTRVNKKSRLSTQAMTCHGYLYFSDDAEANSKVSDSHCSFDFTGLPWDSMRQKMLANFFEGK